MKKFIEIKNWKDVAEQFGLERAKYISKQLREKFNGNQFMEIEYNPEITEAICLFEMVPNEEGKIIYEYTGTAN